MLKINFLGKITINYNGEDVTDKFGNKTLALLCMLILNQDKSLSREKITTYLWPDSNEEAAKYNLRYNLWTIKKHIGPDEDGNVFLQIDRERCAINEGYKYICDIRKIMEFHPSDNDSVDTLEELKKLFVGDFMEGCYFNKCNDINEIIIFERSRFEDLKITILKRLLELYYNENNNQAYKQTLKEVLEIEPYDEDLAYKLMDLYEKEGKRGTGIVFYNNFKNRLINCLGIQPSEFLKQKYLEMKLTDSKLSQVQVAEENNKIEICTKCIQSVKLFWITDVIRQLYKADKKLFYQYLTKEQFMELKYVQPIIEPIDKGDSNVEEFSGPIPDVRIVNTFLEFITKISEAYALTIHIKNIQSMDKISKEILNYLKDEKIKFL